MKKKLAMLFVVIMLLSCMPVMAVTVPAGADTAAATTGTVTTQAASTGWIKVDKYYRYYYAKGKYYTNCVKKIENKLFGFSKKGNLCCGWFTINNVTYYGSVKQGAKGIGVGQILTGYRKIGNDYYYLNPAKNGARGAAQRAGSTSALPCTMCWRTARLLPIPLSMDVRSAQTAQSRILTAMTRRLRATAVRPVTWSS